MTRKVLTIVLIVVAAVLLAVMSMYGQPAAPSPVKVSALTENQIKEGLKHEQREKRIQRAIVAARTVFRKNGCRDTYSDIVGRTAYEYGLSPRLLAAVVFVESTCRPNAVSGRNSVGLMQVNPRVWGHAKELRDPAQNLQIGASILSQYIRRFGLVEGLHHYNGYSEVHGHEYVNKVLTTAQIVVM